MSLEKVQQALINQFQTTFGTTWANRLSWENIAFTPPAAQAWMFFYFMPASERIATLGPTGKDQVDGLVQIDVNYPVGVGESDIRKTINALRTCFKPGGLLYEGQGVTILSRSRAGGMESNGFYKVPFTIRWRAQIPRSS